MTYGNTHRTLSVGIGDLPDQILSQLGASLGSLRLTYAGACGYSRRRAKWGSVRSGTLSQSLGRLKYQLAQRGRYCKKMLKGQLHTRVATGRLCVWLAKRTGQNILSPSVLTRLISTVAIFSVRCKREERLSEAYSSRSKAPEAPETIHRAEKRPQYFIVYW